MAVDFLWIGIGFLVLGVIFYALGARGLGGFTAGIGRLLLWIFVILFLVTLLVRLFF